MIPSITACPPIPEYAINHPLYSHICLSHINLQFADPCHQVISRRRAEDFTENAFTQ
ncbi:hypothetical protein GCWU000342_00962 [Shuttleworthella satelles DSM 14600]|uniref:Uncharacterized protein n=1 Tax=Shuttleworthella satelles DSM 14600 TaxID=626523 RepID=C4GAL2_9FIRM|nr:hypothetical protein GCWU000342_00962 [Shuttleworthia satelles DSM 14600]